MTTDTMEVNEARTAERMDREVAPNPAPTAVPNAQAEETVGPLLPQDSVQEFRGRWDRIQTTFVDDPQTAVKQADELVNNAIQRLSQSFTDARNSLEKQWDRGDQVNTEDLRQAFKKYRAFFQRILTV